MDLPGNSTTTTEKPEAHADHTYIIVPLVVIFVITVLAIIVYLMARRKRRLDTLRQNLMVLYEFDSNEQEWESQSFNIYDNPDYTGIRTTNTAV